ncbi:hypothetical protein CCACVL1_25917 [Corchorus capsularis]|uniref:Uncharacterized protein n=1 Tax=Corchorus capsularis TaxID=210143 RepID=A0A1R3GGJ2_COCAP|nr:hypothetical protein CCACVL1_25917 [Corchorus capsularis]
MGSERRPVTWDVTLVSLQLYL